MKLYGIPAKNTTLSCTQSDGSGIYLTLHGDEYLNYYLTCDNLPVIQTESDDYRYLTIKNGNLMASDILVHEPAERTKKELDFISQNSDIFYELSNIRNNRLSIQNKRRNTKRNAIAKSSIGQFGNYIGDFKGLVLLVEFDNLNFSAPDPNMDFNRIFNSRGYSDNGAVGSVSDYFRDQSFDKFNLTFDIVGPLKMPNNYEYYGANSPISGNDKRVAEMVSEAVKMADKFVDYNDYDWDKDGVVDQVYIIYAGYGESYGAPSNTIWPHESTIDYYDIELDGVKLATYGCSCELAGRTGTTINGIGTSCHEFSHCLGFPDLYDTDYSGAYGMGNWDVMDSGSYNGPTGIGEVPYGYSAYERWTAGWLTPREIDSESFDITLRNLADFPDAAVIYNDGNHNEFYILENHQPDKWFSFVDIEYGHHGMMVTHINYDQKAWASNRVNPNPQNQHFSIIPADNEYSTRRGDHGGDLFPGSNNVTILGNDTHSDTGGFLYNPNTDGSYKMNKSIVEIEEDLYGVIHFGVVENKNISVPEPKDPTEIDEEGFTARWEDCTGADYYILEYMSLETSQFLIPIPKIKRVDNIVGTSLRLDWLVSPEATSKYRVKSVYHGIESEWSEYFTVKYNAENGICIPGYESPDENITGIYGPDGTRRESLLPGINIVTTGRGTKKIFIPV